MPDDYGSLLRAQRLERNLTQRELAEKVGVDYTYLSKVENSHLAPPAESTIRQIARALAADPEEHLAVARKVPLNLKSAVAKYPIEATMLLRAITKRELPRETYAELLRTVNKATKGVEEGTLHAGPAPRSGRVRPPAKGARPRTVGR
jgi:transcriptional regulator with XRE-family HTH domain